MSDTDIGALFIATGIGFVATFVVAVHATYRKRTTGDPKHFDATTSHLVKTLGILGLGLLSMGLGSILGEIFAQPSLESSLCPLGLWIAAGSIFYFLGPLFYFIAVRTLHVFQYLVGELFSLPFVIFEKLLLLARRRPDAITRKPMETD
ncbi:MAG: hypothetical protein Q8Q20_05395 [bacterium]|nr:hypothetical protein [bacterium]